jgi:hypothetical protein
MFRRQINFAAVAGFRISLTFSDQDLDFGEVKVTRLSDARSKAPLAVATIFSTSVVFQGI